MNTKKEVKKKISLNEFAQKYLNKNPLKIEVKSCNCDKLTRITDNELFWQCQNKKCKRVWFLAPGTAVWEKDSLMKVIDELKKGIR